MNPRPALAAALLLALSGCVAFEHAPAAALSCDPALAGRWRSKGDGPSRDIAVDAQCRAQWPVHGRTVEVVLRGYAQGDLRYLVLSPDEAELMLGAEGKGLSAGAPPGSVFLAAYRIRGKRLLGWIPDSEQIQAGIAAGTLQGRPMFAQDQYSIVVSSDAKTVAGVLARGPAPLFGDLAAPGSQAVELQRIGAAP
ncbi:hypothetical protein ASD53_14715 [Lysobacter sp. Root559]|uniref:hypothetical protein n=1 Tax=Lysobacter sp. Root559 TaxID=1736559 RepID=UPI000700D546|nr:hypothetical protein [Lysobacter sp. Root559]KQZ55533.1 hypothetical protein ASD53_14715 [Lysobacter sp. Root559]